MENNMLLLRSVVQVERLCTAFVTKYDGDFNFPGESHDFWELGVMLSGCCGFTSGTELYECARGEMILHAPGVFHTAWAKGEAGVEIMTVSFTAVGSARYIPQGKFVLSDAEWQLVELLGALIRREIGDMKPTQASLRPEIEQMIKNYIELLCLSLYHRRAETARPETEAQAALFAEVAGYLQQRVDDGVTVADVCQHCGVGRTALKELFRRFTGMGVMKYYNALRLRRIIARMENGESAGQIAEQMHFSSQSYLSDFFRRGTGVSPSKYFK